MNQNLASKILLEQLQDAHKWLLGTMEGVNDEVASFQPEGKANPIAGTYAHLIMSEDFFIHTLIQGKKSLMETEYEGKTGASELQPTEWVEAYPKWLRSVKINIEQFQIYTNAVFKKSEEYVSKLTDEDLEKEIDMSSFGLGMRPLHSILGGMVIGHARDIMGEISVLKGIQNLKGYPF